MGLRSLGDLPIENDLGTIYYGEIQVSNKQKFVVVFLTNFQELVLPNTSCDAIACEQKN